MKHLADCIDVFVQPAEDSAVLYSELMYSCFALFSEDADSDATRGTPRELRQALAERGYHYYRPWRRSNGFRGPTLILGAAWRDPELAAEARANRIAADAQLR